MFHKRDSFSDLVRSLLLKADYAPNAAQAIFDPQDRFRAATGFSCGLIFVFLGLFGTQPPDFAKTDFCSQSAPAFPSLIHSLNIVAVATELACPAAGPVWRCFRHCLAFRDFAQVV